MPHFWARSGKTKQNFGLFSVEIQSNIYLNSLKTENISGYKATLWKCMRTASSYCYNAVLSSPINAMVGSLWADWTPHYQGMRQTNNVTVTTIKD